MPVINYQRNNVKKISSSSSVKRVSYPYGPSLVPGESYIHHQDEPSELWVVEHALGSLSVQVIVYTEDWEEMDAGIVIVNENTVHVVCRPALSGYAVVRK